MLYITFCFHLLLFLQEAKNVLDNRCGTLKIFGMCGNMLRDHLSCNVKDGMGLQALFVTQAVNRNCCTLKVKHQENYGTTVRD